MEMGFDDVLKVNKENEKLKKEINKLKDVCSVHRDENEKLIQENYNLDSEKGTRELIDKYFSNEPMSKYSNTLLIFDYYDRDSDEDDSD